MAIGKPAADATLTRYLSGCGVEPHIDRETAELLIKAATMRVGLALGADVAIAILGKITEELQASTLSDTGAW